MNNKGELAIAIERIDCCLHISITDSGKGIAPEIQDKIFQPFFTTQPLGEGSGLGLDIARKIVEKHQGTIAFESIPGRTTFCVRLPIPS
ncbi:MAG: ATP-binding protein, partial [Cyanobacteriota bacterium]|nr:ATP-binding protein [Cyanobacteriota bacterium]